jgi:hypothetical protein
MNDDIKSYIDQRDTVTEQKIKLWIMSSLIAQVMALAPIIFFLGGIYQNANTSLELLKSQKIASDAAIVRIQALEDRQREMRAWAKTKGFIPFTPDISNR